MKYQVIKHNKTGLKQIGLVDNIEQAISKLTTIGAKFNKTSYIGGFPIFIDSKNKIYSIQGYFLPQGIVCSIPDKDIEVCRIA